MPERFGFPERDMSSLSPEVDVAWGHGENTGFRIQLMCLLPVL